MEDRRREVLDSVYLEGMQNGLKGNVEYEHGERIKTIALSELDNLELDEQEIMVLIDKHKYSSMNGYLAQAIIKARKEKRGRE